MEKNNKGKNIEVLCTLTKLREHFETAYSEFEQEVLAMDKEEIFNDALRITIIKDVFVEMCLWIEMSICAPECVWPRPRMTLSEAVHLLSKGNPLREIADMCRYHFLGDIDCGAFVDEIRGNWSINSSKKMQTNRNREG